MGRRWTGARSTNEVMRLELSGLIRDGMIKKDGTYRGSITWTRGGSISIETCNTQDEKFIKLSYTTGESKKTMDYKINLVTVPSNLGNGEVLYFICPVTGEKCRILYGAYGCDIFKSIKAYNTRIYYRLQQESKSWLPNTKYWILDRRIKELEKKRFSHIYKGQKTKRAVLLEKLKTDQMEADMLRLLSIAGNLSKLTGRELTGF